MATIAAIRAGAVTQDKNSRVKRLKGANTKIKKEFAMKVKTFLPLVMIVSALAVGCNGTTNNNAAGNNTVDNSITANDTSTNAASNTNETADQNTAADTRYATSTVLALNWQQQSGEFDALCYQAYNTATRSLEELAAQEHTRPQAVVLDIDETVLDNSISTGEDIQANRSYTQENFNEWVDRGDAGLVSGADRFLNKAKELGVEVFYVTNRVPENLQATIENMNKFGLPNADAEHLLLKQDTSSKQERWDQVSQNYDIIMYCGDNLNDFNGAFYKKSNTERKVLVEEMADEFGFKYIVLPNALYGDWEGAMYDYDYSKTDSEKYEVRNSLVNKQP